LRTKHAAGKPIENRNTDYENISRKIKIEDNIFNTYSGLFYP